MSRLLSILDTNTLVSALCFPGSLPRQAFDRANREGYLPFSIQTFREASEVLGRAKFDKYITREERLRFWQALARKAVLVEIGERITECRDPKDDKFLELAVSAQAHVIVTGDEDLLVLHPFRGIPIVKSRAFLEMELLR